jgi:hypothetical protein
MQLSPFPCHLISSVQIHLFELERKRSELFEIMSLDLPPRTERKLENVIQSSWCTGAESNREHLKCKWEALQLFQQCLLSWSCKSSPSVSHYLCQLRLAPFQFMRCSISPHSDKTRKLQRRQLRAQLTATSGISSCVNAGDTIWIRAGKRTLSLGMTRQWKWAHTKNRNFILSHKNSDTKFSFKYSNFHSPISYSMHNTVLCEHLEACIYRIREVQGGGQLNSPFFNYKLAGSVSHSYSKSSPHQITTNRIQSHPAIRHSYSAISSQYYSPPPNHCLQ